MSVWLQQQLRFTMTFDQLYNFKLEHEYEQNHKNHILQPQTIHTIIIFKIPFNRRGRGVFDYLLAILTNKPKHLRLRLSYEVKSEKRQWPGRYLKIQGDLFDSKSENRLSAVVSLFWHFWMSKGHLCDPKTGRKLLFGKKYSQMGFRVSQEDDCLKKEFQDLVILAKYTGWTKNNFCFLY